jgi:hypothetical protein
MIAHIATEDLPWTEAVTGDWTMADETLASIWPVDYPYGATGWQEVHWTDGRPAAGILSASSLYWRYDATASNANRKRANAISRTLLCHDYLTQPVDFPSDLDVSNPAALADAVRTNPSCVSCHISLDPLAGYLFGFYYLSPLNPADVDAYHPERELQWETYVGVAPGYFGTPGTGRLDELGQRIAADPRFPACVVQQVYEGLLRRSATVDDTDALVSHREAFLTDTTLRSLYRSVVSDPRYRAAGDDDGGVPLKIVTPTQLASEIEGLTGWRWTIGGIDAVTSDTVGVVTLAGGIDGFTGTRRARTANPTIVLVQERMAEAAAAYAVENGSGVLDGMTLTAAPEDDTIATLYVRVLGRHADAEERKTASELWYSLYDGDARAAWAGLLSALLRDPGLLYY